MPASEDRSCAITTTARSRARRSRSSRLRTRLRLETSSALTGSSQKSSAGRVTMTRAAAPDRLRIEADLTQRLVDASRPLSGRGAAGDVERLGDQPGDGEVRV